MSTKRTVVVTVLKVDATGDFTKAEGKVKALDIETEWEASLGKTPYVKFGKEFPKWSANMVKEAVFGALGKTGVPLEKRIIIQEPFGVPS